MIPFKKFAFPIILTWCSLFSAYAQETAKEIALDFASKELQLKQITEGQLAEGIFTFTNNSDTTIVINNVSGSCGCTIAQWPKGAIAPKGKGAIKVVYNSMNRPGYYVKSIRVTSPMFTHPIELKVKGLVKSKAVAGSNTGKQ